MCRRRSLGETPSRGDTAPSRGEGMDSSSAVRGPGFLNSSSMSSRLRFAGSAPSSSAASAAGAAFRLAAFVCAGGEVAGLTAGLAVVVAAAVAWPTTAARVERRGGGRAAILRPARRTSQALTTPRSLAGLAAGQLLQRSRSQTWPVFCGL